MSFERLCRAPQTLAFRLTLWYAGIFVLSLFVAFVVLYAALTSETQKSTDQELVHEVAEFSSLHSSGGMEAVRRNIDLEAQSSGAENLFFRVLTAEGRVLASSDLAAWQGVGIDPPALRLASHNSTRVYATVSPAGRDHRARVIYGSIGPGAVMQIGMSLEEQEHFLAIVRTTLAATLAVLMAAAVLIGSFLARRALQGMEEVTRTASDIAAGALDRRVTVAARGDEIERLATAFNAMLDRIRALITGMREVTDNIAHDLRSPVTRIRGIAEMTLMSQASAGEYAAMAANTIEECDRLLEMINTMLDITETEAGAAELRREDVDLAELAQDACELFSPLAEDKGVVIVPETVPDVVVAGDRNKLQRLAANLVDNAIKYTPSGGKVTVSVRGDDEAAVLAVSDTGIGICEQDLSRIFERFYRGDRSRSRTGTGLGLSLARAIASAHGGAITVASTPGSGSTFTVSFPCHRPPP
jgi:heavy metal sensor kinase